MADRALKRQAGARRGLKASSVPQAGGSSAGNRPRISGKYSGQFLYVLLETDAGELLKEPEAKEPAAKVPEAKEPDPADVFTGKIQMSGLHDGLETGEKEDEDEVPFPGGSVSPSATGRTRMFLSAGTAGILKKWICSPTEKGIFCGGSS